MHPSGPDPASVYWIRRGAVVVVVIAVLALAWWGFSALTSGDGTTTSEPIASVSPSPSTPITGESASASASAAEPTSTEPVKCANADITVTADTDKARYAVGSTPTLTMTITNTGDTACQRDVGPKANELEITSGGYHVWSSDDCSASSKSKVVMLKPDETFASSIQWNGRSSLKGCPDGIDGGSKAKAGHYEVTARNLKATSDGAAFALVNES